MELKQYDNYLFSIARQGNDKNGNPIYIVNIFQLFSYGWDNINFKTGRRTDKHNNVKLSSYDIMNSKLEHNGTIKRLIEDIKKYDSEKGYRFKDEV